MKRLIKILINLIAFITMPIWLGTVTLTMMLGELLIKRKKSMSIHWIKGDDWIFGSKFFNDDN